jgi:hypothetical protein
VIATPGELTEDSDLKMGICDSAEHQLIVVLVASVQAITFIGFLHRRNGIA